MKTKNLELIPFSKEHVEFYKNWMDDEELRINTGTEEIFSLEEWKNIQQDWEFKENMFSWIIFYNKIPIGDINLIYHENFSKNEIELMVMIADKNYRGKGYAIECIKFIIDYSINILKRKTIIVNINKDNIPSIKLFHKLGFKNDKENFDQINMTLIN